MTIRGRDYTNIEPEEERIPRDAIVIGNAIKIGPSLAEVFATPEQKQSLIDRKIIPPPDAG